jgi:hypothetical protein
MRYPVTAWLAAAVMGAAFVVYVTSAVIYLAPPNPVSLLHARAVRTLLHPLFSQNWHLFAPNPVRTNLVLTVRCRIDGRVTPWIDPFTPWLAEHHRNRFSPMGKVLRIPQNAMYAVLGRTGDEWRPLICRRTPQAPTCRGEDPAARRQRELGLSVLQRVGSAVCDRVAGGRPVSAVQPRILIHEPPPWSRRALPAEAGSTKYLALPWLPHVRAGGS